MALPATTTDISKIPEALRTEYKQANNGVWVLTLEGDHPDFVAKSVAQEFRDNNKRLFEENRTAKERLTELDRLEAEKKQEQDKNKQAGSKIEQLAEQVTRLLEKDAQNTAELKRTRISAELRKAALAKGVRPDGVEDLLRIVGSEWDEQEGSLVVLDRGRPKLSDKNPGSLMQPDEYFEALAKTREYFYTGSKGDGTPATSAIRISSSGKPVVDFDLLTPEERGQAAERILKGELTFAPPTDR